MHGSPSKPPVGDRIACTAAQNAGSSGDNQFNSGDGVNNFANPDSIAREILASGDSYQMLVSLLTEVAAEICRLEEENRQMLAAVSIYRDLLDQSAGRRRQPEVQALS